MQIAITGVHQRSTPVALRERLAFRPDRLGEALATLHQYVHEGFILSTCNRVEIGGAAGDQVGDRLTHFLSDWHGIPMRELTPYLYTHRDTAAVRHTFRLAAGLDSMVLGEDQIIGQMKSALATAHAADTIGTLLHRLLHTALASGKLVRSQTAINQHHLSVVSVALDVARERLGSLAERRCLIIGAGHMAELTLKHLRQAHVGAVAITNRTAARANELAATYQVATWPFAELSAALAASDLVISCTSAPGTIIDTTQVERVVAGRSTPLVLLDLAVPRDIDPAVANLPGVQLIGVDDLRAIAEQNRTARTVEATHAEALIEAEVAKFEAWLGMQQVVPTIRELRERAEEIRTVEVRRTLAKCPALSDRERQAIEALSNSIVSKLLHHPIVALKQADGDPDLIRTVHKVFHLTDEKEELHVYE